MSLSSSTPLPFEAPEFIADMTRAELNAAATVAISS